MDVTLFLFSHHGLSGELVLQHRDGNHGGGEGGQEETGDGGHGGDLAVDPEHRRGDVADDGPCTASVGYRVRGGGEGVGEGRGGVEARGVGEGWSG